ncbi:hypothetical protein Q3G72_028597 [Acer saccharum]|nr:hypothetical protein Q3G72_028597 [Acer saccharum]
MWLRASPPTFWGDKDNGFNKRKGGSLSKDDSQSSFNHQQSLATGKAGSGLEQKNMSHPMEEVRCSLGEQVKALPVPEKLAESGRGDMVMEGSSAGDMIQRGCEVQESFVNNPSQCINDELMGLKSDPNGGSGPDKIPSEVVKGELVKDRHGLEEETLVGPKIGPRKVTSLVAQRKGKNKVVGEPASPEKLPFKRKSRDDATIDVDHEARRKTSKIEIQSNARGEGIRSA